MDSRMIAYMYFFNVKRDYFECHEYLESLWLDSGRPVVQKGLIQAAVCLYHLHNGNIRGAYRMWQRAKYYVQGGRPVYEFIDINQLVRDIDQVFSHVPTQLYDSVVSPKQVENWGLPTVSLTITDASIASSLATFCPEPLD